MSGGGPGYEKFEREPAPKPKAGDLLLAPRKERIEAVLKGRTRSLTVVLDRLEDAFNMAAVLRTCESMGLQEVHVVRNPEVPFSPNDAVTQGCDKWLDIFRYERFGDCREALKARGFSLWASAIAPGATSLWSMQFNAKIALVFGNERRGVSSEVLSLVDGVFWIPMRGFSQSMNISAAASACITRAVSWRLEKLGVEGDLSEGETLQLREHFEQLSVKQHHKLYAQAPRKLGEP